MSEKRVKAWAVVDDDDNIEGDAKAMIFRLFRDETYASAFCEPGERVVPVTIVLEEEK